MMRGTPKEPTGTTKSAKKKPTAKKKSSEESGKSTVAQNKNKDSEVPKKVKKPAAKTKTPAP